MTAAKIQLLCHYTPDRPDTLAVDSFDGGVQVDDIRMHDPLTVKLMTAYKNLRFGWDLVKDLVTRRAPLPEILDPEDEWVVRAYMYATNGRRFNDQHVRGALALASPHMKHTRDIMHGLLVCRDTGVDEAAHHMQIHRDTVACYEQLFFNIVDRKKEAAFLSEKLYPDTRFVEVVTHYMEHEDLGRLLMRMGYNNGPEDVLYFAGFRPEALKKLDARDIPAKLEALFAANAFLYLRTGFANQNIQAVRDGKNLLAAAKQGGEDVNAKSPFAARSRYLLDDLKSVKGMEALMNMEPSLGLRGPQAA